eukprot:4279633-Karenia_brevis.AAC.1
MSRDAWSLTTCPWMYQLHAPAHELTGCCWSRQEVEASGVLCSTGVATENVRGAGDLPKNLNRFG